MEKFPFTPAACQWKESVGPLDLEESVGSPRPVKAENLAFDWNLRRNLDIKYDDPGLSYVGSIWVLSRLTYACSNCYDGESSSRINLNVPDTIFFEAGQPTFWLRTLEGKLNVQYFEYQSFRSSRNGASQTPEDTTRGCMQTILDTMRYFWNTTNNSFTYGSPTCVVWFMDGHREEVEIGALRQLCDNIAWKKKLKALQGRVSNQREERGIYRANDIANEDVGFGGSKSVHDEALRVGLNMLTKAIGNCVVKTDDSRGMTLGRSQVSAIKALDPLQRNIRALSIEYLRIVFSVDNRGVLWFSHVEDLQVRDLTTNIRWADGEGCDNSIIAASQQVASELQRLLTDATRAGFSLEQCFGHFDSSRSG